MEDANIIANMHKGRLGTQEITRRGMKEPEIDKIVEFFDRLLMKGEPPEYVRKDVIKLREEIDEITYCFARGRV